MAAIAAFLQHPASNSTGSPGRPLPRTGSDILRFGLSRPTWIVKTESNVHKEKIRKPDTPCMVCSGSGRVDCRHCQGRGRTNHVNLVMLPKGEWPRCNHSMLFLVPGKQPVVVYGPIFLQKQQSIS